MAINFQQMTNTITENIHTLSKVQKAFEVIGTMFYAGTINSTLKNIVFSEQHQKQIKLRNSV